MRRFLDGGGSALYSAAVLAVVLLTGPAAGDEKPSAGKTGKPALAVRVDPRVELVSIVFRLAGHREYNQGKIESYTRAVDERFGKLRDHAAVKLARQLGSTRGVGYDAPMSLALHLSSDGKLGERVPFEPRPEGLDARWRPAEAREFAAALRDFAAQGKFDEFFQAHRPLYRAAEERLKELLDQQAHLEWFPAFFGPRPGASFVVLIGMLNGPSNYGPRCRLADGTDELACVLGAWAADGEGKPTFGRGVVDTVVHEFCHSYVNPLVDRHAEALQPAGEKQFARTEAAMRRQAYGTWKTRMYESLVRACVVRHLRQFQGPGAAQARAAEDMGRQFFEVGELAKLLGDYEADRARYPTLEAFVPRLVAFCEAQAARPSPPATPRVVSVEPKPGATDVDPALDRIKVVFDRPMRDGSWSLVGGGPEFPQVTGKPSYDAARKTWTAPVRLQPGKSYRFQLNSDRFRAFVSADGVPLEPVVVRFTTAERTPPK